MNRDTQKAKILSQRIKFLQRIAAASQKEVERCLAEIEAAQTEEELSLVKFMPPALVEG